MLFSRRIDPVLQHPAPRNHDRHHRRLGRRARRLICGAALAAPLALAGCGQQEDAGADGATAGAEFSGPVLINVTAMAEPAPGGVLALAAMPRTEEFWRGVLFAAPGEGGLLAYDADGNVIGEEAGPRYSALAAAPGFQLRGQDLPLLAALNAASGAISVFAFSRDQAALFEAPTDPIAADLNPRGLCAGQTELGAFEFYVLGEAGGAEHWRLTDTGEARMTAERIAVLETPAPARMCAVNPETGDLYVGAPGAGVARISAEGELQDQVATEAAGMTFGVFGGQRRLVLTQGGGEVLMLDSRSLDTLETAQITRGFSTPGVSAPGAVAYTGETYGGPYPDGFLAVGDAEDDRPKFIDRGYIGRRLAEPENRFAPGPASAA